MHGPFILPLIRVSRTVAKFMTKRRKTHDFSRIVRST
nr:MAG TPA: hypothetical protein [Caudoviricetes sp.]